MKTSLFQYLKHQIQYESPRQNDICDNINKGYEFFADFNNSRLELAFSSFSDEMKKALFEVIYFLHVNDPYFYKYRFTAYKKERVNGVYTDVPYESEKALYVEGALSGVVGIANLSPIFAKEFLDYVKREFGFFELKKKGFSAIYSISSLGSIGTIGHKKYKSDLDLQVQYELEPFLIHENDCTDKHLHFFLEKLTKYYAKLYIYKANQKNKKVPKHELLQKAALISKNIARKKWPLLTAHFIDLSNTLKKYIASNNYTVSDKYKVAVASELIDLYKSYSVLFRKKERVLKDELLKKKILAIQEYVQAKFPKAEIYLFAYSNEDYRKGNHGTTLESKESSGSAYELVLNYEVLMPGIQYTPVVPTHFLMDEKNNSDKKSYELLINYFRFNFFKLDDTLRLNLVDLGATPKLTQNYLTAHSGSAYWESFKASSGNLPKALLNLLRIEMLFDRRFSNTIIEIVKKPELLDRYLGNQPTITTDEQNNAAPEAQESLPIHKLVILEQQFPLLKQDPWWLKYKALKIGFSPEYSNITETDELKLLSRIIDICFALHVRLSDAFVLPKGSTEFMTHRENVLRAFLTLTFPSESPHHLFLYNIFNGDLKNLTLFELGMKRLFKNALARVEKIVERLEKTMSSGTNRDEFRIWYHYYVRNFDPPPNMVQKNILSQLKNSRQRLLIEYVDKKWRFRSIQQRATLAHLPKNVQEQLSHIPDDVELLQHNSFLHGLTSCILNGYYGIINKGTLKESHTQIEFVISKIDLGTMASNKWAFVHPSDVANIAKLINDAFTYQEYDYRDCIKKETKIVDVFFFMNLLKFGQLSVIYRNSMRHWFVDSYYSRSLDKQASKYHANYVELLCSPVLHKMIASFINNNGFKLTEENEKHVFCWLNPNSANTRHSANQQKQKENEINSKFNAIICAVHKYKASGNNKQSPLP